MDDTKNSLRPFPHSRVKPQAKALKDLGPSKLAARYLKLQPGLKGHWCYRCEGVWYGFVGEVECPACGSRSRY